MFTLLAELAHHLQGLGLLVDVPDDEVVPCCVRRPPAAAARVAVLDPGHRHQYDPAEGPHGGLEAGAQQAVHADANL